MQTGDKIVFVIYEWRVLDNPWYGTKGGEEQYKQESSYLSSVGDDIRPLYKDIIGYLGQLGYNPKKKETIYLLSMICIINRWRKWV